MAAAKKAKLTAKQKKATAATPEAAYEQGRTEMDAALTEAATALAEEAPPERKRKRKKGRMLARRLRRSPEEQRWHMWDHDFDAMMHGLAQNPAALAMTPHQLVQFAAGIADAMSVEQDKRNPKRFESFRY